MQLGDRAVNQRIERAFAQWASVVGLSDTLRRARVAKAESGEAFALLSRNPKLRSPIQLDLKLFECDRVMSPDPLGRLTTVDGIVFDDFGNPETYYVLREHPGASTYKALTEFDRYPAAAVVHMYRADRQGQHRGVPELTPELELFAQLRRYRLAVLAAAETAADFAIAMYTDSPATGEPDDVAPLDTIELESRMATTLPAGWKLSQVRA